MVSWEDRGERRYARCKCIDVSASGLRLEVPVPIAARTELSLNAERINVSGQARVRHVARYGAKYLIGVELSTGRLSMEFITSRDVDNLPASRIL